MINGTLSPLNFKLVIAGLLVGNLLGFTLLIFSYRGIKRIRADPAIWTIERHMRFGGQLIIGMIGFWLAMVSELLGIGLVMEAFLTK